MTQVRTRRDGRVLVATLENPPHALMTQAMVEGLADVARTVEADEGIGAVVLHGAHPERFLAHYDVAELLAAAEAAPPAPDPRVTETALRVVGAARRVPGAEGAIGRTPAAGLVALQRFHEVLGALGRLPATVVAAIDGAAMGGGCELALACDLRLISDAEHVRIGQPEILLGIIPGGGGTQRLARLVGTGRALELCLEGTPLTPEEAERIGLVHRVVPHAQVLDEALATAHRLARRPRTAVAAVKRAVLEGGSLPLDAGIRTEQAAFMTAMASPAAKRGMRAYVDGLEATGELPGYDEAARERLLDGTYADLTT